MSLTGGVGWYASDDGGVYALAKPHRKNPADTRRYFMDFEPLAEIVAGDTVLTETDPTPGNRPTVVCGGLTISDVKATGTRVYATIAGGTAPTEYAIVYTITTSGGSVISRTGTLRVEGI